LEEHAEKLVAAVPRDDDLRYAIETLEIEQSRLAEAIRKMRALPVADDDYPGTRVKEQRDAYHSVEQVITFLHHAMGQFWRNRVYADSQRASGWEKHEQESQSETEKEKP
jgi:hypothetical protein